jgi:hypothetical protein
MFIGELPLCFLDIDTPDAVTVRLTVNDLVLIRTPRARRLAHLLEIHNHHLTLSTKHSDRRNTLLYRYTSRGVLVSYHIPCPWTRYRNISVKNPCFSARSCVPSTNRCSLFSIVKRSSPATPWSSQLTILHEPHSGECSPVSETWERRCHTAVSPFLISIVRPKSARTK